MKTITKEFNVYAFDELSSETKEKVIEKYYENETYPFFDDDLKEYFKSNEYSNYFESYIFEYSFSYSQGDHLYILSTVDFESFINDFYPNLKQSIKSALCELVYKVKTTKGIRSRLNGTNYIDIDFNYNFDESKYENVLNLLDEILIKVNDIFIDILSDVKQYGYELIEYRMDFKEFSEYSDLNDYEYLEDGELFN